MHPTALPHCCLLALLALLTMATPGAQARVWPFSGYEWAVRPPGQGEGPGPNDWNDDAANVQTLPSTGWLQIALVRNATAGTYSCSEVYALQPLGYGAYSWIVRGAVDALGGGDPHVVLGLFLYRDDSHEIDLELSRWGNASVGANNGDFVVQVRCVGSHR